MTDLMTSDTKKMLEHIKNVDSIEKAKSLIKQIDALKVALESVGTFRQQSVLYAKLEAEALIRCAELGGLPSMRGTHKKTAEWLFGLTEIERQKYINMCEDGLTIDQVYKREIGNPKKTEAKLQQIEAYKKATIDDFEQSGVVDMEFFANHVNNQLRGCYGVYSGRIVDETKNEIESAGAIAINDKKDLYIKSGAGKTESIKNEILDRYNTAENALREIAQIVKTSGARFSFEDLENFAEDAPWRSIPEYNAHLCIALVAANVFKNSEIVRDSARTFMPKYKYIAGGE